MQENKVSDIIQPRGGSFYTTEYSFSALLPQNMNPKQLYDLWTQAERNVGYEFNYPTYEESGDQDIWTEFAKLLKHARK